MLTAPVVPHPEAPPSGPNACPPVRLEVRQRVTAGVLTVALAAAAGGAVVTDAVQLWSTAGALALVTAGYLLLVARVRRLTAEREMATAFAVDPTFDWDAFGLSLCDAGLTGDAEATTGPATTVAADHRRIHVVAIWALGVVLTPVVGLIRLVGLDLGTGRRRGVVRRLVRAQAYGRSQSLRMVAAGLVATAGVTTAGAMAAGGTAYALPARMTSTGPHYFVTQSLRGGVRRLGARSAHLTAHHSTLRKLISGTSALTRPSSQVSGSSTTTTTVAVAGVAQSVTVPATAASQAGGSPLPGGAGAPLTTTTTAPPPAAESPAAAVAVGVALAQVGKPYVYGGAGPDGFDCSGLVMYSYAAAGVSLPHNAAAQYGDTARIAAAQLLPGDLVFYDNYYGTQPGHVAMYVGPDEVVSANSPGSNVQTQSIGYDGTIIGYGRVG